MENKRNKIIMFGSTLLALNGAFISVVQASPLDAGYKEFCTTDNQSTDKDSSSDVQTTGEATGDWTKKGSKAYGVAENLFKYWTSKKGFSGAAAAGIVGNVAGAEDPTMKLDQKEVGGGSGGGLYQFTPYTKYLNHPKSDKSWSVDNQSDVVWELELANNEMAHYGLHMKTADFAQLTDPKKAAEVWERGYERPAVPAATLPQRQAAAQKAYELFGGANISANSALFGASNAAAGGGNDGGSSKSDSGTADKDPCDGINESSNNGEADGNIVKNARSLMTWFHYSQDNRTNFMKDGKKPDDLKLKDDLNKDGNADCSSFVWLVLKMSGYSVPNNVGWFTGTMAQDAKSSHKWFKQIDEKDAKPGDVIIVNQGSGVGSNGHTAIITENWHGYATKCINEGGDDETIFHHDGVCEDTIERQFGTMLQGSDITIARPVKKGEK